MCEHANPVVPHQPWVLVLRDLLRYVGASIASTSSIGGESNFQECKSPPSPPQIIPVVVGHYIVGWIKKSRPENLRFIDSSIFLITPALLTSTSY